MKNAPSDAGRTVLEAVVALTLVAIAVVSWAKVATAATRVDAAARTRAVALDLATSELEAMAALPYDSAAIDPTSSGYTGVFDGLPMVADPAGLAASQGVTHRGIDFVVWRYVLDPASPSWRRLVVNVTWTVGTDSSSLRLDGSTLSDQVSGS